MLSSSGEYMVAHHLALLKIKKRRVDIARLKALASREKQVARQVELNLEIKRLEKEEAKSLGWLRTGKT